jgi:hypothetical protein
MSIIVSAYFKIPSKKSHTFYLEHLYRFFDFLQGNEIVFFCTSEMKVEILNFRLDFSKVLFILCDFNDLPILKKFPISFWEKHKNIDIETYHTPELGIIWASKKEFLCRATEIYPSTDWFLWVDAGCVRVDSWKEPCKQLFKRTTLEPGVYLQNLNPLPKGQEYFQCTGEYWIAGGLIYAHRDYIHTFSNVYDTMLKRYDDVGVSCISDQYIMASIVNKNSETYLKTIDFYDLQNEFKNMVPSEWFFFLSYI